MSENSTTIAASPDQVFDVLLDGWSYQEWVVGCEEVRAVDPDWPEPGSKFHHTLGAGPVKTRDWTKVVELDRPHRLVLEAQMGPAGAANVEFTVTPADDGNGSTVTIEEHPIDGPAEQLPDGLTDAGLKLRNAETLRRLRKIVEERAGA